LPQLIRNERSPAAICRAVPGSRLGSGEVAASRGRATHWLGYSSSPIMQSQLKREFTVAVFVVHAGRVLLLSHPKLGRWLPPGGHIEPDELPDEAAIREVLEETGVHVRLFGEEGVPVERPRQLVRPAGIQVEDIEPNHQ